MLRPTAMTVLFSMPPGTIHPEAIRPPAGIRQPAPPANPNPPDSQEAIARAYFAARGIPEPW